MLCAHDVSHICVVLSPRFSPPSPSQHPTTGDYGSGVYDTEYLHYKNVTEKDGEGTRGPTKAPVVQKSGWFEPTTEPGTAYPTWGDYG